MNFTQHMSYYDFHIAKELENAFDCEDFAL